MGVKKRPSESGGELCRGRDFVQVGFTNHDHVIGA
jgi:hypothetical protein